MRSHPARWLGPCRAFTLTGALLLALTLLASAAWARPEGKRYTLGMGVASTRVTGGLDGKSVVTDGNVSGLNAYLGKLDNGSGSLLMGGIALSPNTALELLLFSTQNDATHVDLPGETLSAHAGSLLATMRLMVPLGEDFELFGRFGAGPVVVAYDDNTRLSPNPTAFGSTLSGLSIAAGGGIAVFFDPLGLELGVLQQRARLSDITAAQQTVASFHSVYFNLYTVTLTLTMHFKL